jgi:hypothetical protein
LQNLLHLDLLDSKAADLVALRNLRNLQTLRFRSGQVSDLTPLTGLKRVQITVWPGGDVKVPNALQERVVRQ